MLIETVTDHQLRKAVRSRKLASVSVALSILSFAYAAAPLIIPQLDPILTPRGRVIALVIGGIINAVGNYFTRDTGASTIPPKPEDPK